ncbi:MAG: DUF5615 family PIN-like protein [Gammaproteobacteria bacterium]
MLAGHVKLFDENLSPRLVKRLDTTFPGSAHVEFIGVRGQSDQVIWDYAGLHGLTLVSKDNDFRQLGFIKGAPHRRHHEAFGRQCRPDRLVPCQHG